MEATTVLILMENIKDSMRYCQIRWKCRQI